MSLVCVGAIGVVARALAHLERSREMTLENLGNTARGAHYGLDALGRKQLLRPRAHAACDDARDPKLRKVFGKKPRLVFWIVHPLCADSLAVFYCDYGKLGAMTKMR